MAWLTLYVGPPYYFNVGWSWQTLHLGVARTLFAFPLGIYLWRRGGFSVRRESWLAVVLIGLVVALLALPVRPEMRSLFEITTVLLVFPAVMAVGITHEIPSRIAPLFSFLGDISYAVYAVHKPLVVVFAMIAPRIGAQGVTATVLFLTGIVVIATAVAYLFDVPARRWLRKQAGISA